MTFLCHQKDGDPLAQSRAKTQIQELFKSKSGEEQEKLPAQLKFAFPQFPLGSRDDLKPWPNSLRKWWAVGRCAQPTSSSTLAPEAVTILLPCWRRLQWLCQCLCPTHRPVGAAAIWAARSCVHFSGLTVAMVHSFYMLSLWWILWLAPIAPATVVNHQESIVVSDSGMVRREKWSQKWRVKCETTKGTFHLQTTPESPQGVRRFLDLLRDGFFRDQAIFRAVRGSLVQFGISDTRELNEKWSPSIPDDVAVNTVGPGLGRRFPRGTLSFIGTGAHTRNTQIVITLSDQTMGKNPWETPIGHVVEEDLPILDRLFTGYADAVDPEDLRQHGNDFLREFYPRLDYIQSCSLLDDPIGETKIPETCERRDDASPSNAHCHGTSPIGAQTSPRPVIAMHSPVSPHRTTRSGWGHSIGNETGGQSLRCHTLLLRTQPVLLERLTAAESEKRWTTQELGLSFAPESRGSLPQGYPATSEPREPPPASAAAAAAAEAAAAAAWPARAFEEQVEHQVEHVEHVQDQGSAETSSARGQSEAEPMNSPRTQPTVPAHSEKPLEVMVDDEPEVFLEMIRFVYLNTCHVDQGNVKALMHIADKYCIEDIVKHCLQWMQDNFTVGLFYHLLTVQMSHEHFGRLLWNSLLKALRSRRHFALVTAGAPWGSLALL
eukprot:s1693_g6.t1